VLGEHLVFVRRVGADVPAVRDGQPAVEVVNGHPKPDGPDRAHCVAGRARAMVSASIRSPVVRSSCWRPPIGGQVDVRARPGGAPLDPTTFRYRRADRICRDDPNRLGLAGLRYRSVFAAEPD
jgi:hypothetical protein